MAQTEVADLITEEAVYEQLKEVVDPEIQIDVVNLGMIYGVQIEPMDESGQRVTVRMTLTTMGCPAMEELQYEIRRRIEDLGAKDVVIDLTFDPPWTKEMMSEEAKAVFRYLF
jgi:metal-sulfur cluster biosynthetic enzyme